MIAVVTGAGRHSPEDGLGPAICGVLRERGYAVHAWDDDAQALANTGEEVQLHGTEVVDVSDADAVETALQAVGEAPALVVNRLRVRRPERRAAFEATPPQELEDDLSLALVGCSVVCLVAIRRMTRVGRGAIVNVTPALAPYPAPLRLAEGAAAAAIESLTTSLAAEQAPTGVRVNAVALAGASSPAPPSDRETATLVALLGSSETSALNGAVVRTDRGFDPFPGLDRTTSRLEQQGAA